jgi:hypothetical protein
VNPIFNSLNWSIYGLYLYHVSFDEIWNACGRYDNVSHQAKPLQLLCWRKSMANCYGGIASACVISTVSMHQHHCRHPHVLASPNDHSVLAKCFNVRSFQKFLDAQRCAWHQRVHVKTQSTDIFLVEPVNVLVTAHKVADFSLVDVIRKWKLNKNSIDRVIFVKLFDEIEQFIFRD